MSGTKGVDYGRRVIPVRGPGGLSLRVDVRVLASVTLLIVASATAAVVAFTVGPIAVPLTTVFDVILGRADSYDVLIVDEIRAPRIVMALIVGSVLGVSGAIFQSLTRNSLGSPDVIGFDSGAYLGVVVATLYVGGSYDLKVVGALIGGFGTAAVVYLLAFRGGVQGFRLIIVGIGVSFMLSSVTAWLLLYRRAEVAMALQRWGMGTLDGSDWGAVNASLVFLPFAAIAIGWVAWRMPVLEMGDDTAKALGVGVERTRIGMLATGTALSAFGVAVTGPIAFIALAAPQIARRITRTGTVGMVSSAAVGAFLVSVCDIVTQLLPQPVPVGVVTVSVGGLYFMWLLFREGTRR
ncbi:FecCD family ABC transporter permease [Gordonia malaquae]|uniref:FecCD family ABC transporter permease n=1 Tax=Gordonia malaquae TaxID=410332 RepID=UPI003015DF0F